MRTQHKIEMGTPYAHQGHYPIINSCDAVMLGRNMRSKSISIQDLGRLEMNKANSKGKTTTPIRDLDDRELHDL